MRKIIMMFLLVSLVVSTTSAQTPVYDKIIKNGQTYYKYTVKTGEGVYTVSRIFNVSAEEIIKSNPGSESGLRNGQVLLIPVSESPQAQNRVVQDRTLQSQSQNQTFQHTISRGETLYSISKMYNTTVDEIIRVNAGLTENISEGKVISIPQQRSVASSVSSAENYRYHTILPKETLYAVSKAYSLNPEDLIEANSGLSTATFQAGKTIRIPVSQIQSTATSQTEQIRNVIHRVKRGETLYSIAQAYGVSTADIEGANSFTTSKLKTNMEITIPVRVPIPAEDLRAKEIDADRLLSQTYLPQKTNVIKVGLLLPLLDKTDNQHLRLQEYYEGFMLAVKKMKESGANIELFVFEIGTKAKLESLLGTMEMESLNLLIGGVTDEQIKTLSDFSKKHKIKYVIPFSSKNNEVLNNDYIFQVNTPHSYLYSKASGVFLETFRNKNIILVNVPGKSDKSEFMSKLRLDMQKNNVNFNEVVLTSELSRDILPLLKNEGDNIIVPSSGDSGSLNEIISALAEVHQERVGIKTNLFGYPEWQTFSSDLIELMHNFGTYFYTSFFVDNNNDTRQFIQDFKKWYGRDLIKTYPKYGMFGYDTGMFFLNAIYRNGVNFEDRINSLPSNYLQFAFNFERVNNWGGFINTGLFLIHYDSNNTTTKINKSR